MQWVLIGYMFLYIHRPFEVWPVLGELRLERIYMLTALAAWAAAPGKRWLPNAQHAAYAFFTIAILLSWLMSPWADRGQLRVENYLKLLVFYTTLVTAVPDGRALRRLIVGFLAVEFVYMAHSLREYYNGRNVYAMGITRMVGIDRQEADPNSFGTSLVYALPLLVPAWYALRSRRARIWLVGYYGLTTICILLTGSRSSLLGLLFTTAVFVARHRMRVRMGIVAVMMAPLIWVALPGKLQNRFTTIIDPSVGPANAQESAEGRREGFYTGLRLWQQYPLAGCGPNAFMPASGSKLQSHNLYGQLLGETGTLGAIGFLAILVGFCSNIRAIRRAYRDDPERPRDFLYHFAGAVGLSVLLLLMLGNLADNLFRFTWLWYGGFLIVARHCVEQGPEEHEPDYEPEPDDDWPDFDE
jgi:hypothetical protein